ncbi:MAG: response regulator [Deltaproteobacteria bacterium]|nr:response regulator [Deltaproteobacteria bacterium]
MTTTTNILLVDDHPMLRRGLRLLIDSEEGLSVVGEANDGLEAIDLVRELAPDIVVMDINMPNLNGIEATRQILVESPQTRILALSIHSGKQYVETILKAGAAGYLLKESAPEELIKAINVVRKGKCYLSTDITELVLSSLRQVSPAGGGSVADFRLLRPELPTMIVHRPQLIQKLEVGRNKKMTLVAASAGYGKSTLVSDWLAHCDTPSAWLTLDKDCNNLKLFLEYLLTAIRTLIPDACPLLKGLVEAANLPPLSTLVADLTNDLEKVPYPFVLAVDDYSLIEDKAVNDLLSKLLMRSLHSMHLVLICRRDPFLPLSYLRTNNEITEIRVKDLRFSVAETTAFLEANLKHDISLETASAWTERTEGWVAGLPLATYPLRDTAEVDDYTPTESFAKGQEPEEQMSWRQLLTNREYEVLLLLNERLRDKEIADQLCVSTATVKSHLKNLYSKLYAHNRRDAIMKAVKNGILREK